MMPVNVDHVRKFIHFAAKKLNLPSLPHIKLVGSSENRFDAFGHSKGSVIVCRITDRHPIDIMRTLAHEMIHYKQNILKIKASDDWREDNANLMAGRIMRDFDTTHPEVFKDKAVRANMHLNEDALGASAVNSTSAGGVQGFSPLLFGFEFKRKKDPKKLRRAISSS